MVKIFPRNSTIYDFSLSTCIMETFIVVDSFCQRLFYCYPFPLTIYVLITIMNSIFTRFVLTSTFIFARDLQKRFTAFLLMLFSYITTFFIFPLYQDIINMSSYFL